MKTRLTLFLLLFLFGACIREGEGLDSGDECGENGNICLLLKESDMSSTKAFGDNLATVAEKKVKSAKIFIFESGNKVFEKLLSSDEILKVGSTAIEFMVPGLKTSTTYNCYVIINHGDVIASTVTDLQNINETDIATYNGLWNTVNDTSTDSNRGGGFVMTGNASFTTTATLSDLQSVAVTVKRIVAKLDVTTNIDQTVFGTSATNKYQGSVAIDSIKVVKTQTTTPLVQKTPSTSIGTLTLAKQLSNVADPNKSYQNRFYVFENGALAQGSRVTLNIYGTYTNGSASTLVLYPVELKTDNSGAIVRNGAYAINVTITGLTGADISLTITLSNWETVVTQNSSVGS